VAGLKLRRVGLEVGTIARLPWSRASEGTVIAQDPPPHAQGIERPAINLLVAAPGDDTPDGFVMPELVGMPIVSAQTALAKAGIRTAPPTFVDVSIGHVGSGLEPVRRVIAPGSVTAQEPTAGTRILQDTLVKLTVAK
jgi:beta-lactam-binding protein with PASTA domain